MNNQKYDPFEAEQLIKYIYVNDILINSLIRYLSFEEGNFSQENVK